MKYLSIIIMFSILAACAPVTRQIGIDPAATETEKENQRQLALTENLKRTVRAKSVAYPIFKEAAPYCGEKLAPGIGGIIITNEKVPSDMRKAAVSLWNLSEKPTVVSVIAGLPLDRAGVIVGDVVTHVNDKSVEKDVADAIAKPYKGAPIKLTLLRNGVSLTKEIQADITCDYPVEIQESDAVNAFADGKRIFITTGMMRFVESNEELAVIIGHELAHNQMNHINKQMGNRVIGALIGALIGAATGVDMTDAGANIGGMAHSQGYESEADYVGLYHTARAGFNINAAPAFWRRMAVEHPKAIGHGTTHPDTASRFLSLENAVKEISQKREAGVELKPEMK